MGLADRDYVRRQQPSGLKAGLSLRGLSVTTWLILLCVAVYVIDGLSPIVHVPTGQVRWVNAQAAYLDPGRVEMGPTVVRDAVTGRPWRSLHERGRAQSPVLGWQEVMPMHWLSAHLHFSTSLGFQRMHFWRFIGFQFLHANFMHLAFNMLGLFFFGPIVEEFLGRKRYLAFYLLCGMFGAIMYLILNLMGFAIALRFGAENVPRFLFADPSMPLVGASAGIYGMIVAGAFLAPRAVVLLAFIPMRLRTMAYLLVAFAIYRIATGGENAGGEAGHLGGAIAGFYFIRNTHHLHNFFDVLGRADPTSHHYQAHPRGGRPTPVASPHEIDRILAKISRDGLHSLNDAEKRALADASLRR